MGKGYGGPPDNTVPILPQSKHAGESDGERDEAELSEISKLLEKHDPTFMKYVISCCTLGPCHHDYMYLGCQLA